MSNIPSSLIDSSLTLFILAISASDPWPFSTMFLCVSRMGTGDKRHHLLHFHINIPHIHFHHHHHHDRRTTSKDVNNNNQIPKGCVAILVGLEGEQERFIVPVMYMNHPLFMQLLKEAEEEYGFEHNGPINIPCHVEEFRYVQGLIHQDLSHHQHHNSWCFKA